MRTKPFQPTEPQEKQPPAVPDGRIKADVEKVFRAQGFRRGDLVFVRIPYAMNTDDFLNAARNIDMTASEFGVSVLVFDEKTDWDALVMDDKALYSVGLMRVPK